MSKFNNKQNGFSAVEGLLVLVMVVLLGVLGYMVYENRHKPNTASASIAATKTSSPNSAKPTVAANPYSGWKTYSSDQVSFRYPSNWTATISGQPQSGDVAYVDSTIFSSSATTTADNPGASIDLNLQLSTASSTIDCADAPCKVTAMVPLTNSQLANSVLAVVNQTSGNGTTFTQYVVASNTTKVGDTTINAIKAGSSGVYVFGQPEYNTNGNGITSMEAARVSDVGSFRSDSHFEDLVSLINSIKFD